MLEDGTFAVDDQERHNAREALLTRLDAWERWNCAECGQPQRGSREDGLCHPCQAAAREALERRRPRADILRRAGVPPLLRSEPDWLRINPWPVDPRSKVHPAKSWPRLASELTCHREDRGPRSVVLFGANGAGKSHRAADLVAKLHGNGLFGAAWIREGELVHEEETTPAWDTMAIRAGARDSKVLVLDDVLSTEGDAGRVKRSLAMLFELVDYRTTNTGKITIYTTHRPLLGPEGFTQSHPAIYSRWTEGLIIDCGDVGYRRVHEMRLEGVPLEE